MKFFDAPDYSDRRCCQQAQVAIKSPKIHQIEGVRRGIESSAEESVYAS